MRLTALTPDLLRQFYGAEQNHTVRGFAVMDGDNVEIVVGIYAVANKFLLFSDVSARTRALQGTMSIRRVQILICKRIKEMLQSIRVPIISLAEQDISGTGTMLEHAGFKHLTDEVYIWQA